MLSVKTPEEALEIIRAAFRPCMETEAVPLRRALGRILAEDVVAGEYVPDFDRSTVDGYAVRAADTFGCSEAIPALLPVAGEILMGQGADGPLPPGACAAVPTGGALPAGADAVVMVEHTEDFGDGTVGVLRPAAPGENLIYRGDDVRPGGLLLPAGHRLEVQDVGALAALGLAEVPVRRRPVVGLLSTGDELVPAQARPGPGQIRDVNAPMLAALAESCGAEPRCYGIVRDEEALLADAAARAAAACDVLVLSGGSSVGERDAACRVVERLGEVLFHGVAMKPGKPTLLGSIGGKPVLGLPGHPAAAFFAGRLFLRPLLARLCGRGLRRYALSAVLTEAVGANHGREQYTGVFLEERDGTTYARPIRSKSGLITGLAGSDGYFRIPRDCEGIAAGERVAVTLYSVD